MKLAREYKPRSGSRDLPDGIKGYGRGSMLDENEI